MLNELDSVVNNAKTNNGAKVYMNLLELGIFTFQITSAVAKETET